MQGRAPGVAPLRYADALQDAHNVFMIKEQYLYAAVFRGIPDIEINTPFPNSGRLHTNSRARSLVRSERPAHNRAVVGSNPSGPTFNRGNRNNRCLDFVFSTNY